MSPLTNLTCTHTLHTVCFHINVLINSDNNSNSNNKKIDAEKKKKILYVRSSLHVNVAPKPDTHYSRMIVCMT